MVHFVLERCNRALEGFTVGGCCIKYRPGIFKRLVPPLLHQRVHFLCLFCLRGGQVLQRTLDPHDQVTNSIPRLSHFCFKRLQRLCCRRLDRASTLVHRLGTLIKPHPHCLARFIKRRLTMCKESTGRLQTSQNGLRADINSRNNATLTHKLSPDGIGDARYILCNIRQQLLCLRHVLTTNRMTQRSRLHCIRLTNINVGTKHSK
mmetsp:Transcript_3472/g.7684  ORF Transcript_3472/g.7684 Transcript_3472/m.7684 type:complete len:205 (-) Transcript_3472:1689-2303(-)